MTALRVLAGAHDHGAADDFAAVHVERAAAEVAADLDGGDVFQIDRRAFHRLDGDEFRDPRRLVTRPMPRSTNSTPFSSTTLPPTLRLAFCTAVITSISVTFGGAHLRRGKLDLILLHEAADARDFGHALHAGELVADVPILHRAELREVVAAVPAPSPDRRRGNIDRPSRARWRPGRAAASTPSGICALEVIQPLQHAGAGEVVVDLVLEDDRDQREAEHRSGAHLLHSGEALQAGGERIGDLVLDLLRAAAHPVGIDEHLVFPEVRDGIDRREVDGADAERDEQQRGAGDEEAVSQAPFDDFFDHGLISFPHSSISAPKNGLRHAAPAGLDPAAFLRRVRECASSTIGHS